MPLPAVTVTVAPATAAVPLGDENPTRRRGWVTYALIAVNIGVFALLQPWNEGTCEQAGFFLRYGVAPDEVVDRAPLTPAEVATTPFAGPCGLDAPAGKSVPLAVLTAMFLHGSWVHLLGNMLYLWVFGDNVEDRLGRVRYLVFYLVCGVIATVGFSLPNASSTTTLVGASGAIAGVLGAYLVMYPTARVTTFLPPFFVLRLPALLVLGLWFLFQVVTDDAGMQSGAAVAYLAHVVGFVAGAVIVLLLGERPQRPRVAREPWMERQRADRRRSGERP